jgi:hypothetical protein
MLSVISNVSPSARYSLPVPASAFSDDRECSVENVCCWDLPPYLELDDLSEHPEARMGTGEGDTLSQGDEEAP